MRGPMRAVGSVGALAGLLCLAAAVGVRVGVVAEDTCEAEEITSPLVDCGYVGVQQGECEARGCCWQPSAVAGQPWCFYPAPEDGSPSEAVIESYMAAGHIPGVSLAVVKGAEMVWNGAYGIKDMAGGEDVALDTDFMLASISKTVTSIGIMQAQEQGIVDLDVDVNKYLDFEVQYPGDTDAVITLRNLMTHTGCIEDTAVVNEQLVEPGDTTWDLETFMIQYLSPDGDLNENSWLDWDGCVVGGTYHYTSVGLALAALAVQTAVGEDWAEYTTEGVFKALEMENTGWTLAALEDASKVANPYLWNGDLATEQAKYPQLSLVEEEDADFGTAVNYFPYGKADYPSALVRTSATELAKHLGAFMNFGSWTVNNETVTLLSEQTASDMRVEQIPDINPDQALVWQYKDQGGRRLLGHTGSDPGVATEAYFNPDTNVGVIALTNGDWSVDGMSDNLDALINYLYDIFEA